MNDNPPEGDVMARSLRQLGTSGIISVALAAQQAEEMAEVYSGMVKAMKGQADAASMENAAETENAVHTYSQQEKALHREKLLSDFVKSQTEARKDHLEKKLLLMDLKYQNLREDSHSHQRLAELHGQQVKDLSRMCEDAKRQLAKMTGQLQETAHAAESREAMCRALAGRVAELESKLREQHASDLASIQERDAHIQVLQSKVSGMQKIRESLEEQLACAEEGAKAAHQHAELVLGRQQDQEKLEQLKAKASDDLAAYCEQLSQETREAVLKQVSLANDVALETTRRLEEEMKELELKWKTENSRAEKLAAELKGALGEKQSESHQSKQSSRKLADAQRKLEQASERIRDLEQEVVASQQEVKEVKAALEEAKAHANGAAKSATPTPSKTVANAMATVATIIASQPDTGPIVSEVSPPRSGTVTVLNPPDQLPAATVQDKKLKTPHAAAAPRGRGRAGSRAGKGPSPSGSAAALAAAVMPASMPSPVTSPYRDEYDFAPDFPSQGDSSTKKATSSAANGGTNKRQTGKNAQRLKPKGGLTISPAAPASLRPVERQHSGRPSRAAAGAARARLALSAKEETEIPVEKPAGRKVEKKPAKAASPWLSSRSPGAMSSSPQAVRGDDVVAEGSPSALNPASWQVAREEGMRIIEAPAENPATEPHEVEGPDQLQENVENAGNLAARKSAANKRLGMHGSSQRGNPLHALTNKCVEAVKAKGAPSEAPPRKRKLLSGPAGDKMRVVPESALFGEHFKVPKLLQK